MPQTIYWEVDSLLTSSTNPYTLKPHTHKLFLPRYHHVFLTKGTPEIHECRRAFLEANMLPFEYVGLYPYQSKSLIYMPDDILIDTNPDNLIVSNAALKILFSPSNALPPPNSEIYVVSNFDDLYDMLLFNLKHPLT